LQQPLLDHQVDLSELIQAEAATIPEDDTNVPTVIRKGIGRTNVPNMPGTSKA
jgi:hypothetical protein